MAMKRLFAVVLTGFVLLTLSCTFAIVVGHEQPEALFIPELNHCGDFLCYLGVLPGATGWDEGMTSIRQAPQLKDLGNRHFLNSNSHYEVSFYLMMGDGIDTNLPVIGEMDIGFPELAIVAGNLVKEFGPPCTVFSGNTTEKVLSLEYPNAAIFVVYDGHRLTPESPVMYVNIRSSKKGLCQTWQRPSGEITGWKGFGRYP